jgi:ankyrin repeat protein
MLTEQERKIFSRLTSEDINVVKQALECGANINMVDEQNNTPMYIATYYQRIEIMKLLLEYPEIDLTIRGHTGMTPIELNLYMSKPNC